MRYITSYIYIELDRRSLLCSMLPEQRQAGKHTESTISIYFHIRVTAQMAVGTQTLVYMDETPIWDMNRYSYSMVVTKLKYSH